MTVPSALVAVVGAIALTGSVYAAPDDLDALSLQSAPESSAKPVEANGIRTFVEGAGGRISRRYGLGGEDAWRASFDFSGSFGLAPQWRAVLSDRVDTLHPVEPGTRTVLNSLREAYIGWQQDTGRRLLEVGRINYRQGAALAYNPTDYFRDGAIRAVTSADPVALRDNRLGTAMARAQQLWTGGSLSLSLAPRLRDQPSGDTWDPDFGATNHSHRAVLALGVQASDRLNGQFFAVYERGKGAQLGLSGTALLSDAVVGYIEASAGRDAMLLPEAFGLAPELKNRTRFAGGATFTAANKLSLTLEFEANGFAASRSELDAARVAGGPDALATYLYHVQRRQDIASRRALVVYASQRDGFVKKLDFTGFVREDLDDRSRFYWAEVRYHFPSFDLATQWQTSRGRSTSEYGSSANRSLMQLLGAFYF